MPTKIINEHTDRNIKEYLSKEEKTALKDRKWTEKLESEQRKSRFKMNRKTILAVLFLALFIFAFAAYFMFKEGQKSFDNEKVKISIEAQESTVSGEELSMALAYSNKTDVALNNIILSISTPKNFIFSSAEKEPKKEANILSWNIGELKAGETGKIKIFGKIIGEKDNVYDFSSKISYKPSNFNSEFKSSAEAGIKISSTPFELSVNAPSAVINGEEIDYFIEYQNISGDKFDAVIKTYLPNGFLYLSSEPKANEEKENYLIWKIDDMAPGAEKKKISIKGKITGNKDEEKEIKTILEASKNSDEEKVEYLARKASIKIQEIPIAISQAVNGSANYSAYKGEELEYKIKFKNISDKEIKGLVINSELEGNADFRSLTVANGSYDDKFKMTWSAFNVPELASLASEQEGEVSFKVKVKEFIEIKNPNDKNLILKNKAVVSIFNFDSDSSRIGREIASSESEVKLNSSLFIRARGYFNDDGRIKNFGFIPPEAGKETSYTIHWNLSNLFNDIENLKVISVLPPGAKWTGNYINSEGKISLGDENNGVFIPSREESGAEAGTGAQVSAIPQTPSDNGDILKENTEVEIKKITEEKFYYNPETREIVWELPKLDANTGILSPAKEVVFQISVTPEESDAGNVMEILGEVKAEGYDEFAEKEIAAFDAKLTTELPDDESIGVEEGIVIPASE